MNRRGWFALLGFIALRRSPAAGLHRSVTRTFVGPDGWVGYELGRLDVCSDRCLTPGCRMLALEDGRCWDHGRVGRWLETEHERVLRRLERGSL
jgi:hypothetical protein